MHCPERLRLNNGAVNIDWELKAFWSVGSPMSHQRQTKTGHVKNPKFASSVLLEYSMTILWDTVQRIRAAGQFAISVGGTTKHARLDRSVKLVWGAEAISMFTFLGAGFFLDEIFSLDAPNRNNRIPFMLEKSYHS